MVKTFKRIAALAMAIALVVCFAVSASAAVNVNTTTTYTDSTNQKVNVSVRVSGDGISSGTEVTYYAFDDDGAVYIDQTTANASSVAEFNFQTAETKLDSTVKVGYTGATEAKDEYITANTIKYGNVTLDTLPTEQPTATVNVTFEAPAGKTVKDGDVAATNADATVLSYANNIIVVSLSEISGDVDLTITPSAAPTNTAVADYLDAALKTIDDGHRQFTVLGAATGIDRTDEYGVIITTEVLDTTKTTYTDTEFEEFVAGETKFAAVDKADSGVFAVQVIDEGGEGEEFFEVGKTYYVAVYAKTSNNTGYVVEAATVVTNE